MRVRPARPADWAGHAAWRVLLVSPHAGRRFLDLWEAWRADSGRPAMLHVLAIEVAPDTAAGLRGYAAGDPALAPLAEALANARWGLLPGFHRLGFDDGQVLLTLGIGAATPLLRAQGGQFDAVELTDPPASLPVPARDRALVRALARLCRAGATLRLGAPAPALRPQLASAGFVPDAADVALHHFAPGWPLRRRMPGPPAADRCTVIGAGLAGAAVAASLARRGWQVTVLDAADTVAAGASAVPAGMLAPHQSPDDNLLSRLSRAGVRMTLQQAQVLLVPDRDWHGGGALEVGPREAHRMPADAPGWRGPPSDAARAAARLAPDAPALWHARGAWIRPAALVQAWLAQPRVRWRGGARVDRLVRDGGQWRLLGADGHELDAAPLVVLCAGTAIAGLASDAPALQPVRGQLSWAPLTPGQALPGFPVNGDGHFLAGVPIEGAPAWMCGSTYDRGETDLALRADDHAANLARLGRILPAIACELAPVFDSGAVRGWTGIRCASADRRPIVGELAPSLWMSSALGSRGLTFAALCAELLAARLHAEPLPLAQPLAAALDSARFAHPRK